MTTPPESPSGIIVPVVHKITELYKNLYRLGTKIPKRDRFGIHREIESECLITLNLSIQVALKSRSEKAAFLQELRTHIEILKHLIRASHELHIIESGIYLDLQKQLQEISKMALGWLRYCEQEKM